MLPLNSLHTAEIENSLGIQGSYYFRIVPQSFNEKIIKQIADLGHEIGYHYEEMDTVYRKWKMENGKWKREIKEEELIDEAYELFCRNLEKMRQVADIKTICMHGSPLSKFDNKAIWEKYNYRDLGIIGEPYFDINWNEWGYLTDTGRRWDAGAASVRDKVGSKEEGVNSNQKSEIRNQKSEVSLPTGKEGSQQLVGQINCFKTTQDIIDNVDKLPDKLMITIHPQRWTNRPLPWLKELVFQNAKNVVKRYVVNKSGQRAEVRDRG